MVSQVIPSKSNIEYVIFDMDGLLVSLKQLCSSIMHTNGATKLDRDSEKIVAEVTDTILGRYGHSLTWEIKAGAMGKPLPAASEWILSHFPDIREQLSVEEFIQEGARMKAKLFREVEPMRGAAALVKGLYEAGIPIALATGSSMQNFIYKTTHLPHIFGHFPASCIITADSPGIKGGKPNPDIFLAAAHSLGRDVGTSDECSELQKEERRKGLVFEDSVPGVLAGVAAGMNVIWVPHPEVRALNPEETYGAREVLAHLEEWDPTKWDLPLLPGFGYDLPVKI
ncbi:hypothetical protein J010_04158 [Cryptococcus neoformans]|uniref:Uncharacterized protein n=1 Tax=Cryptococcus neoformans Tu259-1 TaxID=1230072 RepID=A0A854QBC7_CRYNE|nr:hypothetical protein C353_04252 [Cryptococcus neoformans var. grubii AD1-83a]OXG18427.1 hypothetical protein C361_04552 [Cryptococcus neoformans var. grubii Tu259-1]OXG48916.1 hypothetical protein C355_04057 [Cryptococcus neoformans var. grubii Th84]OXG56325.1 hypothetical protein C354_04187 [Cryptococcus neoformans var. grubii MW-RSA1955]OXG60152.1 hypothetical protein C352_04189 [Cryptococcus neoformans var. grubii CHC193]OXG61818.1 hypothetical protein C351_04132 [Cryptococcus neoformans